MGVRGRAGPWMGRLGALALAVCVVLSPACAGEAGVGRIAAPGRPRPSAPAVAPVVDDGAPVVDDGAPAPAVEAWATGWEGRPVALWNPLGLVSDTVVEVRCAGPHAAKAFKVFRRDGGDAGGDADRALRCRRGWVSTAWDQPEADGTCRVPVQPYARSSLEVRARQGVGYIAAADPAAAPGLGLGRCAWTVRSRVSWNRVAGALAGAAVFRLAPTLRDSFGFRVVLGTTTCSVGWLVLVTFLAVQLVRPRVPGTRLVAFAGASVAGLGASARFVLRSVVLPGVADLVRSPFVLGYLGIGILVGFVVSYLLDERLAKAPRVLDLLQWLLQSSGVALLWVSLAQTEAANAAAAILVASNFVLRMGADVVAAAVAHAPPRTPGSALATPQAAAGSAAAAGASARGSLSSQRWRSPGMGTFAHGATPEDLRRLGRSNSVGRVRPDLTFSASPTMTPVVRRAVSPLSAAPRALDRTDSGSVRGQRPSPPSTSGSTAGAFVSGGGAFGTRHSPPSTGGSTGGGRSFAWDGSPSPTSAPRDRSPLAGAARQRSPLPSAARDRSPLPSRGRSSLPAPSVSPATPSSAAPVASEGKQSPLVKMGKILNPTTGNLVKIDGPTYKALVEEGYTPDLVQGVLVASPDWAGDGDDVRSPSTPAARGSSGGKSTRRSSARSSRLSGRR